MLDGTTHPTSRLPPAGAPGWKPVPEKSLLLTTGTGRPAKARCGLDPERGQELPGIPRRRAPAQDVEHFSAARPVHHELVPDDPMSGRRQPQRQRGEGGGGGGRGDGTGDRPPFHAGEDGGKAPAVLQLEPAQSVEHEQDDLAGAA